MNYDNNLADIVLRINTAMNHISTKPGGGGVLHNHRRSRRRSGTKLLQLSSLTTGWQLCGLDILCHRIRNLKKKMEPDEEEK